MAYDRKCYDLAEAFLDGIGSQADTDKHCSRAAQGIQDYIEDFLSDLEDDRLAEAEAAYDESVDRKMDERRLGGTKVRKSEVEPIWLTTTKKSQPPATRLVSFLDPRPQSHSSL